MKKYRRILWLAALAAFSFTPAYAQDDFDDLSKEWDDFMKETDKDWEAFRDECNREFADLLEQSWKEFAPEKPMPEPKDMGLTKDQVMEVAIPPQQEATPPTNALFNFNAIVKAATKLRDRAIKPLFKKKDKKQKEEQRRQQQLLEERRLAREQAVQQAQEETRRQQEEARQQQEQQEQVDPLAPVEQTVAQTPVQTTEPKEEEVSVAEPKWLEFQVYGTTMRVNIGDIKEQLSLPDPEKTAVANAWRLCSTPQYKDLIDDCLQLKEEHQFCDWAYLQMLYAMASAYLGEDTNEATFLTAYIYCQSGYRVRLGAVEGKLLMLYGTQHVIFGKPAWSYNGEYYYALNKNVNTYAPVNACPAAFEQEESLSLLVPEEPKLDRQTSSNHIFTAYRDKSLRISVDVNKNLMDFFASYPPSRIGDDHMTRWVMLANTPLDQSIKDQLYPSLKKDLEGRSKKEAVARLLDLMHGFAYELDEKRWGRDRAFFAEETLFYEVSDCEDHAILFSRLVRDLLGMDVALVHYENPGHLACAVHFEEGDGVQGDYMQLGVDRYYVTDPTYFGSSIGMTMPIVKNARVNVATLE